MSKQPRGPGNAAARPITPAAAQIAQAADGPATVDPVEIALEAVRGDPAPDSPGRQLLVEYRRLIAAQTARLGRQRWRDFIITALGVCALTAAGVLIWDAARAGGVVVEPFAAPPDMAEQGLSGPVLATRMLDKLTAMQAETISLRAPSTYANDWDGDIAVEIPSTGVSIGELRRFLRDWLGHQTRLSGEVVRLADGQIEVTTRVGTSPSTRMTGAAAELDALLQQGAEAIYAETQPYRYAVWLSRQDRGVEANAVLRTLTLGAEENDRLWGYTGLGTAAEDPAEMERYYESALRLRPDFVPAMNNLAGLMYTLGRDERAYQGYREVLNHVADARRELTPGRTEALVLNAESAIAELEGDLTRAADLTETSLGKPATPLDAAALPLVAASFYASAHDIPRGRRILEDNGLSTPEAIAERLELVGAEIDLESVFAVAVGDWAAERERLLRMYVPGGGDEADLTGNEVPETVRVELAMANAALGRMQREILGNSTLTHFGIRKSPVFVGEQVRGEDSVAFLFKHRCPFFFVVSQPVPVMQQ